MNSASSNRLCVPVEPFDGESLLSLIARAAKANAFERPGQILVLAGVPTLSPHYSPFSKVEDAEKIAHFLSLPIDQIKSRMHPAVHRDDMLDAIDWYGTPLARKYITAKARRYSPAALQVGDFHRAISMIKPVSFCPSTGELLKAQCRAGHRLGWAIANGNSVCNICEESLLALEHEVEQKLDPSIFDDCINAAALVSPDVSVRNTALANLPLPFCTWEAGDVFTAVVELGVTSDELTVKAGKALSVNLGPGDFSSYSPSYLAQGYRVVRDWPESLNKFLDKELTDACRTSFVRYNPLGKFFAPYAPKTPFRDLLRKCALDGGFNIAGGRRSLIARKILTGNTDEMAERFNIRERTLRRLHAKGHCLVSVDRRTHRPMRYDVEMLAVSIAELRGGMRSDQCSRLLGVPAFCISALVTVDMLKPVTDHDALTMAQEDLFKSDSVRGLAAMLRELPLSEKQRSGVAVSEAMFGRFVPEDWADVVVQLILGKISVVGKNALANNVMDELIVDKSQIEAVLNSLPHRELPPNIHLSNTAAAKILGVSDAAIGCVVRAGWLRAVRSSQMEIPLIEVAEFHRVYVTASEGARTIGTSQKMFVTKMKEQGLIPPIKLRKLSGWRRSEAEPAFERILTQKRQLLAESKIAKQLLFGVGISETGVAAPILNPR